VSLFFFTDTSKAFLDELKNKKGEHWVNTFLIILKI